MLVLYLTPLGDIKWKVVLWKGMDAQKKKWMVFVNSLTRGTPDKKATLHFLMSPPAGIS